MQTKSNNSPRLAIPVVLSFAAALVLSVVALPESILGLRPDFVALVLIYWCLHYPSRVGLLIAFSVGLLADAMFFGILGQHAIAKLAIAYVMLRFFSDSELKDHAFQQSIVVLLLLILNVIILTVTDRVVHGQFGSHMIWLTPPIGAIMWYLFAKIRQMRTPRRHEYIR
ncbi:MAG: rod shape-determining protein MreD [Acidiferrobacterales bacterium]|nr:rod shape-determining protein MreD [Acidiferrobacterales bacterium]